MSEGNVEVVHQSVEAFERRDRTAWLALHDESYEVVAIDDWPEAGVRGAEPAWDFYLTIFDAIEGVADPTDVHDIQVVEAGADKVLVHHSFHLSARD